MTENNSLSQASIEMPQSNKSTSKPSLQPSSITDSAYDSPISSPFNYSRLRSSSSLTSPLLADQTDQSDDIFSMSLEQIDNPPELPPSSNSVFRPISRCTQNEDEDDDGGGVDEGNESFQSLPNQSQITIGQFQRNISTQTSISAFSFMYSCRPNSAPLQECVEEELEEINMNLEMLQIPTPISRQQIPRNSTYNCIRSPGSNRCLRNHEMPDVIPPSIYGRTRRTRRYSDNIMVANRLSLIADEIDNTIIRRRRYSYLDNNHDNQNAATRSRYRRSWHSSYLTQLTPNGSLFDLLVCLYHAAFCPMRRRVFQPQNNR